MEGIITKTESKNADIRRIPLHEFLSKANTTFLYQ